MKVKDKKVTKIILALGVILRFVAFILTTPAANQHDVLQRYGHFDYAMYLFKYGKLAPMAGYEFNQPPINAFMQSSLMRLISIFKDYGDSYLELFSHTKILSLIYSVLTLVIIYKILEEFDLPSIIKNTVLTIMSFYPGLIIMTTQYSNDLLSYVFFYLSLLLTIRWCKRKDMKGIILLALSIGIGMLVKISVGLIAFITGPMMLLIWFRTLINKDANKTRDITLQLAVFAIIVFPIGLSYSIRNYIRFDIPLGAISEVAEGSALDLRKYKWTLVDRFLSLPISRIVEKENGIYHDFVEYNIWIDLIKTASYDEFNFKDTLWHPLCIVIYILNYIFHILGLVTIVLNVRYVILGLKSKKISVRDLNLNIRLLSILLFIIAIAAYVGFNYKYPYSCNSNYRYIAYISLALAINIATFRRGEPCS